LSINKRLADDHVRAAFDLATLNPEIARCKTNVFIERTIEELNGISCIGLEDVPPAKK